MLLLSPIPCYHILKFPGCDIYEVFHISDELCLKSDVWNFDLHKTTFRQIWLIVVDKYGEWIPEWLLYFMKLHKIIT